MTSEVISWLESGKLSGQKINGEWFVSAHGQSQRPRAFPAAMFGRDEIVGGVPSWLSPRFDELTLFIMSIAVILLFLVEPTLRSDFVTMLEEGPTVLLSLIFPLLGFIFTVINIFLVREKSGFERHFMVAFAIYMHAGVGILVGVQLWSEGAPFVYNLLPAWNIVSGVLLYLMLHYDVVNHNNFQQENAHRLHLLVACALTFVVVLAGTFIWEHHWAITMAAALGLASPMSKAIDKTLSVEAGRSEKA